MTKPNFGHKPIQELIKFVDNGVSPSGITRRWLVVNTIKPEDDCIGVIRWHGAWRKYVYECDSSFYDWECMRLIADFIEAETIDHRQNKIIREQDRANERIIHEAEQNFRAKFRPNERVDRTND